MTLTKRLKEVSRKYSDIPAFIPRTAAGFFRLPNTPIFTERLKRQEQDFSRPE